MTGWNFMREYFSINIIILVLVFLDRFSLTFSDFIVGFYRVKINIKINMELQFPSIEFM